MKKSRLFFVLFIAMAILSCNKFQKERNVEVAALSEIAIEKDGSANSNTDNVQGNIPIDKKKIIKDGSISIKTVDVVESKKSMDVLVKKYNAYYDSEVLQNNEQILSYDLKLRIPADNFEKFISEIEKGKDEISNKSIHSRDVTEEFVDIEARLANKREYLTRYKALLAKAATIKDILAIEENIRILQEEIESKEGRLKYLSDQVAYSTLDINLFQEKEYIYKAQHQQNFAQRAKRSVSNGWTSIIAFFLWLISIWPFIILIFIAAYIYRGRMNKRKLKMTKSE